MKFRAVKLDEIKAHEKGALVSGPFGSNIGSRFFVAEGIPVIRGNNLSMGEEKFIDDGFVFITEDKAHELKNCNAKSDDIIFTAAGTLGQVGLMPKTSKFCSYIISNKQIRLRLDKKQAFPPFVYYFLSSPDMRAFIASQNKGSSVPLLTLGIVRNLKILLPSLTIQKKIAAILSAYDELIENNKRRIALLEKMAEEIYREWFVRLRFPGHEKVKLENRPLREFIFEYIGGDWGEEVQSPKFGNPVYVIRGTDFENVQQGDISSVPLRYIKDSGLNSRKLKAGDLIVENSVNHQSRTSGKSLLVTQHVLDLFDGDVICASFCKLIRPKNIKHSKFLSLNFRLLFNEGLFDYFQNIATNGIANLQAERFMDRHLIPFHEDIGLSIFESLDASLLARAQAKLKEARDKLLPRLISGKLSVENLDIQFPPGMAEELS